MDRDEIILVKAFGTNIDEMLIVAAYEDDTQEARRLIEAGADVNTVLDRKTGALLERAIKENDAKEFYKLAAYVKHMIERDCRATNSLLATLAMYHNEIH